MVSLLNDARVRGGDAPGLSDFRLAYAARAKSVRFCLALIVFAGRLRDDQHSRLASPISTTKVETVHPQVFEVYVWVPPIFSYVLIVNETTD